MKPEPSISSRCRSGFVAAASALMAVPVAGARVQHVEPRAIGADGLPVGNPQIDARMAERAVAAVAGDCPVIDMDDLEGERGLGTVGHEIFYGGMGALMIAIRGALSTIRDRPMRLAVLLSAMLLSLAGCAGRMMAPMAGPAPTPSGVLTMDDGAALPYRAWMPPSGEPWAVVLALHGMNDSRDAWEIPAPDLAAAGIAVIAPDQRGFGATTTRGYWASGPRMVADAADMARTLRARYPKARLILMGESMGAAVLMVLATQPHPPPVDGYVLVAPAVWGRAEMNVFLRSTLWLASTLVPAMEVTQAPVRVTASDNRDALLRLSRDPLTLRSTRVDSVKGLVDLMDAALASAPHFHAPALFLYGGKDELVPGRATAATWEALAPGERRAFYPNGYHLLLRDLDRAAPIADVIAWIRNPAAPLPSGAETAASRWIASRED